MDLEARARWVDYAEAKDEMFAYTDTRESPWYVVDADDKRTARLNLISHLLSLIPYEDLPQEKVKLPPRQKRSYVRPPQQSQNFVPARYAVELDAAPRPRPARYALTASSRCRSSCAASSISLCRHSAAR